MTRTSTKTALLAAALLTSGCVHKVSMRMDWTQPPLLTLPEGASVFVDGQAAPVNADNVVDGVLRGSLGQVVREMAKGGTLPTLEEEFRRVLVKGRFQLAEKGRSQYVVRLTPTAWNYSRSGRTGMNGHGKLDVRVTVLDAANPDARPLYQDIIWGKAGSMGMGEPEAVRRAAAAIADEFLTVFAPSSRSGWFELDGEDPACEPGIELAEEGLVDGAYDSFFQAMRANPGSAPALYNFAVMTGVKGNLDESERLMTEATKIQQKKLYYRAIDIVRSARQQRDAASAPPPVPVPTPGSAPATP